MGGPQMWGARGPGPGGPALNPPLGRRKLGALQSIEIEGTDEHLEHVHSFKHLGIIINEQLDWSDHIDCIQKKVSSSFGILRRIRHLLPN